MVKASTPTRTARAHRGNTPIAAAVPSSGNATRVTRACNRGSESDGGWDAFYPTMRKYRRNYTIYYYFTDNQEGPAVTQADRDYIAQAIYFYMPRRRWASCPDIAEVTANLDPDVQGPTANGSVNNHFHCVVFAAKQINAMVGYVRATRANHNNVVMHLSVDGSRFFPIR